MHVQDIRNKFRAVILLRITMVVCSALILKPAVAFSNDSILSIPAIIVKNPADVILISVARAGARLVAVGVHGVIAYSDDNGLSWQQAKVPVNVTLTTIAFATPMVGWAGGDGGVVLYTVDGGMTWSLQITGTQVLALMSTTANQMLAAAPDDIASKRALRRASIFLAAGPDKPFLTILPLTSEKADVFGAYRMAIATDDGGKAWRDISLKIGDPISHNLYGSAQIGSMIFLVGESGTVLRSDDGGGSFYGLTSPAPNTLLGVLSMRDSSLLAYGVAGGLFRSSDLGKSWVQVITPEQSDITTGLVLKNGIVLLASETGHIYESTDQGSSFQAIPVNVGGGIFDMTETDDGKFVFVGPGGVKVMAVGLLH
jgi:photosystem II stability/assembly factor-like uncharacterized protein